MAGSIIAKTISQEVISEVNQPLYIGGKLADGSDAKITVASNGNVSTATPLTVPSLTVNSKPVMSSLLAEYTVTGSAVTSINFSGLDINTHKSYRIELEWYNTAGNSAMSLFINADNTITNYYRQNLSVSGTSINAGRGNDAEFAYLTSSKTASSSADIQLVNGYARALNKITRFESSAVEVQMVSVIKIATVTNITQLTFTAGVANAIGVGSTVRIYRGDV